MSNTDISIYKKKQSSRYKLLDDIETPQTKYNSGDKYKITTKYKHLLCKNVITNGVCNYGDNCKFAHNIDEQIIEPIYKKAHDIIIGNNDLSKINIYNDKELYKVLLKKCSLCENCNEKSCSGGYNCRNGAINKNQVICIKDLNEGKCNNKFGKCSKVHLTERGLIPYMNYIIKKETQSNNEIKLKNKNKNLNEIIFSDNSSNYENISLSESIFEITL